MKLWRATCRREPAAPLALARGARRALLDDEVQRSDWRARGDGRQDLEHLVPAQRQMLDLVQRHPGGFQRVLVGRLLGRPVAERARQVEHPHG